MRLCLLLGLLGLLGSPTRLRAAEEPMRVFPAQKCRFTLPVPDWTWIDMQAPNILFVAGNTKGFVINLTTVSVPVTAQINEQFVKEFEKSFYSPGQIEKRAGRFVTFRGLPSYQAEGILADGRTTATRVFKAHGLSYNLSLIGAKEPVEDDPQFEKLMQGFEFTVPPEQEAKNAGPEDAQAPARSEGQRQSTPDTDYGRALNISELMGRIVGVCIIGILLLLLFRWWNRKRKTGKT